MLEGQARVPALHSFVTHGVTCIIFLTITPRVLFIWRGIYGVKLVAEDAL